MPTGASLTESGEEVRCPECHALLFKGKMRGEIKCWRCKRLVKFTIDKGDTNGKIAIT